MNRRACTACRTDKPLTEIVDYGKGMRKLIELEGDVPVLDFNDPAAQASFKRSVDAAIGRIK